MTDLGRLGVWVAEPGTGEWARQIERIGYRTLWVGASPIAGLDWVEPILEQTDSLVIATGVVNIWSAPADAVAASFHRIDKAHPGRFLLGLGVGHREHTHDYRKPLQAMADYLDHLDAAGVPVERRLLAALGPKVLQLSAQRSAGAHPALTTRAHTALARQLLGPTKVLAPAQAVLRNADAIAARAVGRQIIGGYLTRSNYVNSWRRLGFTDADLTPPGSDALIDALIAHGKPEDIAARIGMHLDAGASHVAVQVLGDSSNRLATLTELAGPLGLKG